MLDLKGNPFYLNDSQRKWVGDTLSAMTDDQKAEQLFCPLLEFAERGFVDHILGDYQFGGVTHRSNSASEVQDINNYLQEKAEIPLLISANFEHGGIDIMSEGTYMGRQMLIAATDEEEQAYRLGRISGREGDSVGANWSFAPVIDIDFNCNNPITNVRTYGNDPDRVIRMGKNYIKGLKEGGLIPTIKHFPGDGVDFRDQHLVTTINSLSIDEWEKTYGKIYREMIEDGAMTVMVGHIAMPAMEEKFDGKPCEKVIPATNSRNIMTNYLRGELGFNGLISTDASDMVGLLSNSYRNESVPDAIENGADVLLFVKNVDEDVRFMKEGIASGRLSRKRLDEAVTRILAVKAALHLHEKKAEGSIYRTEEDLKKVPFDEHTSWAEECADKGVTLVKDTAHLLPISPEKHKRVLFELIGDFASNERVEKQFTETLEAEGFEVTRYVPETIETIFINNSVSEFRNKYDLVLYVGNIETASNKTAARINWHTIWGAGNNIPWFAKEVPTVFVSVGNPYHLMDVPMVHTFINGYCNSPYVIKSVIEKLLGRSEFKGKSPVDPFCGLWDARF